MLFPWNDAFHFSLFRICSLRYGWFSEFILFFNPLVLVGCVWFAFLVITCLKFVHISESLVPRLSKTVVSTINHSLVLTCAWSFQQGHLHTYRFCDNVWTFILQDAVFKSDECQENVSRVKIVACDSKLLMQWESCICRGYWGVLAADVCLWDGEEDC